ncbi:MAG: DUF4272 domain-containing protein [Myxococcales bacterium]|nr:DUF4272 domain-containing protein [Myxococcales bacterium]MBK7198616.1 DUF4272 domain-containing protein [Myxococcales bacterium]MBP6846043.1 DUF4272 domain-containing protein [Kofleriaceae bacterium]
MSREANLTWLRARGFKVAASLPEQRGDAEALRPVPEMAARLMALQALYAWVAYDAREAPDARLRRYVQRNGLEPAMAADERRIYRQTRARARRYGPMIGWALEMMWPLAWVLGFPTAPRIEDKAITRATSTAIQATIPPLDLSVDALLARARPRSYAVVARLEDRFYCAHNAVRSAHLGRRTVPRDFDLDFGGLLIAARRHALAWCLSPGKSWAKTPLDT